MSENSVNKTFLTLFLFVVGIAYPLGAAQLIDGIELSYDQIPVIITIGVICSLLNLGIKPLFLAMPEISIGWRQLLVFLLLVVINGLYLWLMATATKILTITTFPPVLWAALLISSANTFLSIFYEVDVMYFEGFLLGAVGGGLAYGTIAFIPSLLGFSAGWLVGLAVGAAVVGALSGIISGMTGIYNWRSPTGWIAFISSSSWGLIGTTIGVLLHTVNLFYGSGKKYQRSLSHRKNCNVYDGGFGFAHFAFTQGTVISNLNGHHEGLLKHETLHVWQSLSFGPLYQGTYVSWLIVGFFVSLILGLFVLNRQGMGRSIMDVAYLDNPWEVWAYSVGGAPNGGALSYIG